MKYLTDWGFSSDSWKGQRGEYLVLLQGGLMVGFVLLPTVRPIALAGLPKLGLYGLWAIAGLLALFAIVLIGKGLLDLGNNLTPLPYPKSDGELVQSGMYGIVRHPLYSGLILLALAWTIAQLSLSHLVWAIVGILFFNVKASREEAWLTEKYPGYSSYQQHVKKLIPWVY